MLFLKDIFTDILRIHSITAVNFYFEFWAFKYQPVCLLVEPMVAMYTYPSLKLRKQWTETIFWQLHSHKYIR